jgi:hypothetical protein
VGRARRRLRGEALKRAALLALVPLLAMPVLAAPAPDPSAEAVLATLPFLPSETNRVLVDLAPPGQRSFPMMLDTGAQASVVTPVLARQLGVTIRRDKSSPYRRRTVLDRDLQFHVDTRTSDTGSRTGFEYGLLGGDFLDDYVVEIDFPGRRVRFLDAERFEVPEAVEDPSQCVVPLLVTARRPFAEVEVDGEPLRVLVDTGAPFPLLLSGSLARKAGIDVDALAPWGRMGFTLGSTEGRLHEAAAVRFGAFTRGPMPVLVLPRGSFNLGGATDSVIGYDLLAPFVVRIDYQRARMWLERTASMDVTLLAADWALGREIGALLTPADGAWVAWNVEPGGPAHVYGIREQDRIEADVGDVRMDAREVGRRVRAREPLTVTRPRSDDWVEVLLPEPRP